MAGIFEKARQEEATRLHVRNILEPYVKKHLTTDYVQFTEQSVSELLSQALRIIPLVESQSLRPPTEPFEALARYLNDLEDYRETPLRNTPDVVTYLKNFIGSSKPAAGFIPKSGRVALEDDYECFIPQERFEPIMSRVSRKATPRPGHNDSRRELDSYQSTGALLKSDSVNIKSVQVDAMKEPEVNFDSTLNLALSLTTETASAVKTLMKSTVTLSRPNPNYRNRYLHSSGLHESDKPLDLVPGTWMSTSIAGFPTDDGPALGFTPIFPRDRRVGGADGRASRDRGRSVNPVNSARSKSGSRIRSRQSSPKVAEKTAAPPIPNSMADLVAPVEAEQFLASKLTAKEGSEVGRKVDLALSKVKLEETEGLGTGGGLLYKENMVVINGWETYVTSSPVNPGSSSSTPNSSQEQDQLDELLNEWRSSPDTEPSSLDLLKDSRMDLPAIPRARRIGGAAITESERKKVRPLAAKKSYAAFLLENLSNRRTVPIPGEEGPASDNKLRTPPKILASDRNAPEINADRPHSSSPSLSMLGQPPSASVLGFAETAISADAMCSNKPTLVDQVEDFNTEIRGLYLPTLIEDGLTKEDNSVDPMKIIQKEKLDEKGVGIAGQGPGSLLMEVPNLPPPNEHPPNDLFLPNKFSDYLLPPANKNAMADTVPSHQYLKKAKGIQPITLQLSWIPFTVAGRMPTHLEVTGVVSLLSNIHTTNHDKMRTEIEMQTGMGIEAAGKRVTELINRAQSDDVHVAEDVEQERWEHWDKGICGEDKFCEDIFRSEIILSREERKRLLGLSNISEEDATTTPVMQITDAERQDAPMEKMDEIEAVYDDTGSDSDKENWDPQDLDSHFPKGVIRRKREDVEPEHTQRLKRPRLDGPDAYPNHDHSNIDDMLFENEFFDDSGVGFISRGAIPSEQDDLVDEDCYYSSEEMAKQLEVGDDYRQGLHPDSDFEYLPQDQAKFNTGEYSPPPSENVQPPERVIIGHNSTVYNMPLAEHDTQFEPLFLETQTLEGHSDDVLPEDAEVPNDSSYEANHQNSFSNALPQETASSFNAIDRTSRPKPSGIPSNIEYLNHSAGIAEFASLRGKKLNFAAVSLDTTVTDSPLAKPEPTSNVGLASREIPPELVNKDTFQLPSPRSRPTSPHWYMASMDLLQKQALVRSLSSQDCAVDLIERESLHGVDLILDPFTAVIFINLPGLPAKCEELITLISQQSWRYSRILVVFEAYSPSLSLRASIKTRTTCQPAANLNVYSPPVIKAVRKFRRDISVAEACEKKDTRCKVLTAFANSVEDAACFARLFGDMAEREDAQTTGGLLWGDRAWLEDDTPDEEESMAAADGMNRFAAYVILCQTTVDDFLEMVPEERITKFGPFIGNDRMTLLNRVIDERVQAMENSDVGTEGTA
ncbi:hypothetical protein VKT23_013096 [Stygiomarasmius scandens]|uniref:Uncharacterized protein n=1 Tax=Marasmiellus scandens TaxID=2682957 RepID=A0ABR1J3I1_9AGAR